MNKIAIIVGAAVLLAGGYYLGQSGQRPATVIKLDSEPKATFKLMLCAGLVHGDLSEFNVLVDENGPVIIDLPQAVDAAANNNAREMFDRDVNKITSYYALFAPELQHTRYAKEMWALYEEGELQPETVLTGLFEEDLAAADVDAVLQEIKAALAEEAARQERLRAAEEPD